MVLEFDKFIKLFLTILFELLTVNLLIKASSATSYTISAVLVQRISLLISINALAEFSNLYISQSLQL